MVSDFHRLQYLRFMGGAQDQAAIDGWCAVMDARQQQIESESVRKKVRRSSSVRWAYGK